MNTTRRAFLQALAAAPLLGIPPLAIGATTYVRYDLATDAGQEMLGVYAGAIRAMRGYADGNPLGWLWRWYSHFVSGATTKSAELTRIFGSGNSTEKALAIDTWNTCQPHSGQNPNRFLPWHRMAVYYFEHIVRHVSGRNDFALPYWNYTSDDPSKRAIVPKAFRMPGDAVFGPLYRSARSSLANAGDPIDEGQPGDAMDIGDAMAKTSYSTTGSVAGFCRAIDSGIHGRIHALVGTSKGMGAIPYAGNDPLFWVHHANIDRMWASWNRNGHRNPTDATTNPWINDTFVFVDGNGLGVKQPLKNFFSASALGYGYDNYIAAPTSTQALTAVAALAAQATTIGAGPTRETTVARAPGGIELGAHAVRVQPQPTTAARWSGVPGLDDTAGRTYLVVRHLHAWSQPEVLFHLYVSAVQGPEQLDAAHYAGNINFLDAEFHDHGGGSPLDMGLGDNLFSFDVTEILALLRRQSADRAHGLRITIVPGGVPAGGHPMIGALALVRR